MPVAALRSSSEVAAKTTFAKQIERLAERDLGLIGTRPAAALWRDGHS